MKTRAAVAVAPGADLELRELEVGDPRPDELRIRMVATGVCHTDAIIRDQWYPVPQPVVLGHEGAGIVEAVGSAVTGFAEGDHVVVGPSFCGACRQCEAGHPMYCERFYEHNFGARRADGTTAFSMPGGPEGSGAQAGSGEQVGSHFFGQSSFAEHTVVPARGAVKVPEDAPLELIGPLGCGLMTGAGAVLNVLRPGPGDSIAIFGAGAVGMAAMLAARAAGASEIVMVDVVPSRLAFARELGATRTVDSREADAAAEVRALVPGGVDLALDTTGAPAVFGRMAASLATRGHGALVGAAKLGTEAAIDIGSLLMTGLKLSMVIEGDAVPRAFIPRLIRMHADGAFPFDRLVRRYPFAEINRAFADSASGETLKPVLVY